MNNQYRKEVNKNMARAIIYCRTAAITAGTQLLPDSIKRQLLECINYAKTYDYEITDIVREQGNGLVINKELQNAIKKVESGEIKTIIVLNYDRISRDCQLTTTTLNEVKHHGGEIKFCNEDVSLQTVLAGKMKSAMNLCYRQLMSERIKKGIEARKQRQETARSK